MATYNSAQYGRIELEHGKMNVSPEMVFWSSLLHGERYEVFDPQLDDYDPLRTLTQDAVLQSLPTIHVLVKPEQDRRPDLLAYDYLGDPDYYQLLMRLNGLLDETEFTVGKDIKIPVKDKLDQYLLRIRMEQER